MQITAINIIKEQPEVVEFEIIFKSFFFGIKRSKTYMITSLTCTNHCLHNYKGEAIYSSGVLDKVIIYAKLHNIKSITKFSHIIK